MSGPTRYGPTGREAAEAAKAGERMAAALIERQVGPVGPTRWVVREGSVRGEGAWITCDANGRWQERHRQRDAWYFDSLREAGPVAHEVGGRVVALLTHEQSKAKAAADALRKLATEHCTIAAAIPMPTQLEAGYVAGLRAAARDAREAADALWPRSGGRR